ncbi:hypothetical protein [Deinococcus navajonensis]|uniref:DUF559 domain-containing protein n=1 Tax=Deinococcus navajonensis TaxID=309884 RepID=A0ABV8XJG6_9DEIO
MSGWLGVACPETFGFCQIDGLTQISLNHEQELSAEDEQRVYEDRRLIEFCLGSHWRNSESVTVHIVEEDLNDLCDEVIKTLNPSQPHSR